MKGCLLTRSNDRYASMEVLKPANGGDVSPVAKRDRFTGQQNNNYMGLGVSNTNYNSVESLNSSNGFNS